MNLRNLSHALLPALLLTASVSICGATAINPAPDPECRESVDSDTQFFTINRATLPVTPALRTFVLKIDSLYRANDLASIKIIGSASPDGRAESNDLLAARRVASLRSYIVNNSSIPADFISENVIGNNWEGLEELASEMLPSAEANAVITICRNGKSHEARLAALKHLNGGRTWITLRDKLLPKLRYTLATACTEDGRTLTYDVSNETFTATEPTVVEPVEEPVVIVEEEEEIVIVEPIAEPEEEDTWMRHFYIKTNLPAWLMLWTNAALEIDCAPHWSATLSCYYSGFNYFSHRVKFRTLTFMPEMRYWFRRDNVGPFIGAHMGVAYFNCAFNGDYRYQDHDAARPALGGGLDLGWRFNLRNPRWKMEVSVGYGIYHLDYDLFMNHYNGMLVDRVKRTFYGIDNAAFSLIYTFDLPRRNQKKGGDR